MFLMSENTILVYMEEQSGKNVAFSKLSMQLRMDKASKCLQIRKINNDTIIETKMPTLLLL